MLWRLALRPRGGVVLALVLLFHTSTGDAQAPVEYRLTFPAPEHRWMQVAVTFPQVPPGALQVRMSRTSPGRYALHEFAKNVFDVRATDAAGRRLTVERPNLHQWDVSGHEGTVRMTYRVFGDRVDGTYLGVDSTHAHINMPAALMWARGFEDRPATVRFDRPARSTWRVATQLLPGADPLTFHAPNLQYLMDSPTEFSDFTQRTFQAPGGEAAPVFRVSVHHHGSDEDVDQFTGDVQKIVVETRRIFGEFPAFEGNSYTFIGDYVRWANSDAMEHRNSTFHSSPSSIRGNRQGLLSDVAHEFFHAWNVERIRPRALEPFNLEEATSTRELWLAEGVTSYYAPLVMMRSGLTTLEDFAREMADTINAVVLSPGRQLRTAEDMSALAPFVDAAISIDRTNFDNTFISYYTWGEAIGLALDLSLRDRTDGRVTLDHFMRRLWETHGKPGGRMPGYVDNPYTTADVLAALSSVSGDAAFARDFLARYVQGHEVADYARLLARAGLVLRSQAPGQGFAGDLRLQDAGRAAQIVSAVPMGSPAYAAGLERDDVIVSIGGTPINGTSDFERTVRERRPGESFTVVFERRGQRVSSTIRLVEDPRQELAPIEDTGRPLGVAERRFRDAWLSSLADRPF